MIRKLGLTLLVWINFFAVFPCGWDSDTLAMERQLFPSVHEVITGKFLQHSEEFYYWRVKDREEKIKLFPDSLNYYDDLAWAYNKIGDPAKGVEIMLQKEAISPGLYTTYANLGTCYIHAGQFEEGLVYIKKAIEINPEAHFGREVYQQYLVEYVLEKKDSTGKIITPIGSATDNYFHYLEKHHFPQAIANGSTEQKEIAKAVKGVAGMMKFSNHNSPILLEALGDLLDQADSGVDFGAGHLASRAYLKAALLSKDEEAIKSYKKKANNSRERSFASHEMMLVRVDSTGKIYEPHPTRELEHWGSHVIALDDLELVLKLEIQTANEWVEEIRQNEISWIEAGINPDSAFAATYYQEPSSSEVAKYFARKRKDEIEEEYWLGQQWYDSETINQFHTGSNIDDSTRQWLDSIYEVEFSVLPDEPVMDSLSLEQQTGTPTNATNSTEEESKNWLPILGGIGIILLVILGRRAILNRKK